jgi:hypothetical protein
LLIAAGFPAGDVLLAQAQTASKAAPAAASPSPPRTLPGDITSSHSAQTTPALAKAPTR